MHANCVSSEHPYMVVAGWFRDTHGRATVVTRAIIPSARTILPSDFADIVALPTLSLSHTPLCHLSTIH